MADRRDERELSQNAETGGTVNAGCAACASDDADDADAAVACATGNADAACASADADAACATGNADADAACAPSVSAPRPCCCGRHKHTPRSAELQRDVTTRLNRVIGQLNGVKAMIDDNRYCGDVLTQLAAAQSALSAVSRKLLQEHLQTCVVEQIREGDTEVIDELMQLIKKFS